MILLVFGVLSAVFLYLLILGANREKDHTEDDAEQIRAIREYQRKKEAKQAARKRR